ncbi:hypothetical protein EOD41_11990 [Mucilaginibacter limnophilus]|uniref:Uncharacterized protein n=1 Tax=Mucilaginibacter limnophilus TaxID=1932778 RepID=A0A437MSU7_9SPHI|nr:hypothetical protein [Mucilaginibacter limnophilus]RVU00709.1 hypothetical protein EOD41_11990 [Mucilaginibacter limnophilus]
MIGLRYPSKGRPDFYNAGRKHAVTPNTITTIAGGGLDYQDGKGANARFYTPYGRKYLCCGQKYQYSAQSDYQRRSNHAAGTTAGRQPDYAAGIYRGK